MANSSEILGSILNKPPESQTPIVYQFLVPNKRGVDNFLATYKKQNTSPSSDPLTPPPSPGTEFSSILTLPPPVELAIFTAATESFTQKNTNCSIAESLERFAPIFALGRENNLKVRAYISVALGCPYEGPDVDPHKVADLAVTLLEMGADEISVADTTGMGTAPKTRELLKVLAAAGVDIHDLALHFHDTYGMALVNTIVGLEAGVRTFDAAVGGLGGCPYSPGATGNVASEDLVYLFETLGLRTGVDLVKLSEIGEWISREVGKPNESRAGKASLAQMRRFEKGA
jgi:hydroxymethylglutaryl-CoA lyase